MAIITQADLEARLGPAMVEAILDDENSGIADAFAVERILDDASSKVLGYATAAGYPLAALVATPPNELKRLALDAAEVLAARRHPEVVRKNWRELDEANIAELMNLRKGATRLDVANGTGIEPPATRVTSIKVGGNVEPDDLPDRFFDDMGDF